MTREALKLALEAFEAIPEEIEGWIPDKCTDAVIAIKEALAQPEQEPVAVVETIGGYPDESAHVAKWLVPYKSLKAGDKLYTTPPQRTWVGLDFDTIEDCFGDGGYSTEENGILVSAQWLHDSAHAIEAKLKEKNT